MEILNIKLSAGEVRGFHENIFRLPATNIYNIFRRTKPSDADPFTLNIINEILAKCNNCQRVSSYQLRYRV